MNLLCGVCSDLISSSDEITVTPCGHMYHYLCLTQWFERSSTCPQCRNKCSNQNVIRLYVNESQNESIQMDPSVLHNQIDNLKLTIREKDMHIHKKQSEIKEVNDKVTSLKLIQKNCRQTIMGLEEKINKHNVIHNALCEQVQSLKLENKKIGALQRDLKEKQEALNLTENIQNIISSTVSEVEALIKSESSIKSLATLVVVLKRELRTIESKRVDLRNTLKISQSQTRKYQTQIKGLNEKISMLESDNSKLMEDNRILQRDIAMVSQIDTPLSDATKSKEMNEISKIKQDTISPIRNTTVINLDTSNDNSPYFNIKSSSIGLSPLLKNKLKKKNISNPSRIASSHLLRKTNSSENFSIFKKPRLTAQSSTTTSSNSIFDGVGGSEGKENYLGFPQRTMSSIIDERLKKTKVRRQ